MCFGRISFQKEISHCHYLKLDPREITFDSNIPSRIKGGLVKKLDNDDEPTDTNLVDFWSKKALGTSKLTILGKCKTL
jgi:hypothetical protein